MLSVEEITPRPIEQRLITVLDPIIEPLYRSDLPWHNYIHAREDALQESLRLDDLDPVPSTQEERLELIVEDIAHDALGHVPLRSTEGYATKEERTAAVIAGLLRGEIRDSGFDFSETSIINIGNAIIRNRPGIKSETPNEVKLRRGDLKNLGSEQTTPFLAAAVSIFYEKAILALEVDEPYDAWPDYLDGQIPILGGLLMYDLSIRGEPVMQRQGLTLGRFNRTAQSNVGRLANKREVRTPRSFVGRYGHHLKLVIPDFEEIVPYILGEA
jgi:hypothetical protein